MTLRGDLTVPARAFGRERLVSWVIVRRKMERPAPPVHEEPTRPPPPLTLSLPNGPRRYLGLTASLALHGLLIVLLVLHGERVWSRNLSAGAPAPGNPGSSAAGGGGPRVSYITLPSVPEAEAPVARKVPPPVSPPKRVAVPAPQPEKTEVATPVPVDTASHSSQETPTIVASAGQGSGSGPGTPGAGGQGRGSESGAGTGTNGTGPGGGSGKARPPEPRDMAFPFDSPPKELRGISLSVTFWVRVDGVVERYTVEPEIKDRDYAKKFDEVMRAFRFTPAQAPDGTRVPGTTRISFTLPGKSSS
jgi:hypothetical protein